MNDCMLTLNRFQLCFIPFHIFHLISNSIFVNLASEKKVKFMISFIGFSATIEFSFPYHIFALPWLSTTWQDSLRFDYITSLLSRPLELSKGETHYNLSCFHEYLWNQATSEYSLDFCVSADGECACSR